MKYILTAILIAVFLLIINYFIIKKLYRVLCYTLEEYFSNFISTYIKGSDLAEYLLIQRFGKKEEKQYIHSFQLDDSDSINILDRFDDNNS